MNNLALTSMIVAGCLAAAGCVPTVTTTSAPPAGASYNYACSYGTMTVVVGNGTATAYSGGTANTYSGGPYAFYGEEESLTFSSDFSSVVWAGLGEQETCYRA